ncbi:MAG TPA: GvpL/GvpF family gas vesicle protein [Acidimicrobiales bacterium]
MITAYAIACGVRRPARAPGIEGVPVELVPHRGLVAAVTRHDRAPRPTRAAVVAHAAVCEAVLAAADAVLPVRFGAAFADGGALAAALDERHDQLVAGLTHVRGRVEVGVRVRWAGGDDDGGGGDRGGGPAPPPEPAPPVATGPAPGRAYLMARVAADRRRRAAAARAEAVAARIDAAVRGAAADRRLEVGPAPGIVLAAAYLVDRGAVDRLVAAVRAVGRDEPEVAILCTGPWPPYSFADGGVPGA